MLSKNSKLFVTGLLILLMTATTIFAASGKITGKVVGKDDGEPLFAANVFLMGTSIGAATDLYGKYEIKGIPAGTYILKVSYLGLEEELRTIDIAEGQEIVQNFELGLATLEGEAVVITAQAAGQKSAINQQLSSKKIMNVVSSEKIQELPLANAAETVGRLPGISIQREGGEGTKLVVRGLEPKYNAVLVNGIRLSSNNQDDRSVDLSMISPYILEGIEVTKNVTPDMDADVLGGTVDFKIRNAGGKQQREELSLNFISQGGYNGLDNATDKYSNYKFVGSAEQRFLDGKLGVFLLGDYERKNLTSNEMGLVTDKIGNSYEDYRIMSLTTQNIPRDRERFNGSLVLDYVIPDGNISFTNSLTSGKTDVTTRSETFNIAANQHLHDFGHSEIEQNILLNALSYEQSFEAFDISASFAHTYNETSDPNNYQFTFREFNAFKNLADFKDKPNIDPTTIPSDMVNDFSTTNIEFLRTGTNKFTDRSYTGALDLSKQMNLSKSFSVEFKIGGKIKHQTKEYDDEVLNGAGVSLESARKMREFIIENFNSLSINSYLDNSYSFDGFLDNEYTMVSPLDAGLMARFASELIKNKDLITGTGDPSITYARNTYLSKTNDYKGEENLKAFYGMATIDIGDNLNIIAGFRYQNLETEYTSAQGKQAALTQLPYDHYDTTATQTHEHFLPTFIVRYKPFNWLDVRAAYTNTLSYPDFQAIIPRIDENSLGGTLEWNNSNLNPTESENFDISFSFHDNYIGLFTIGGFYKKISNQIYRYTFVPAKTDTWKYFPQQYVTPEEVIAKTYNVSTYLNNNNDVDLWGIEVDWQTNLWYLPEPFNGLVLSANYTHTKSETNYNYQKKVKNFPPTWEDQTFEDRLISQPNDLFNFSLGYDYKDFSMRVSLLYNTDIFAGVNFWPQLRTTTAEYTRWDLSVKQKLPFYGIQVYGVFSNLNNEKDREVLQMYNAIPQSIQSYGMTATFGLRWTL